MAPVTSVPESSTTQYIGILLADGFRAMVPTAQLVETINVELGHIVQMPDLPPAVVGVCGWRGDVLWLVDLAYALRLPPLLAGDYGRSQCHVLRVTVNHQTFGILVAEVQHLIRGDRLELLPGPPGQIPPEVSALVAGQFRTASGETILSINLEALLDHLKSPG
ncbi:chemotaxis protein CheW [Picosynechococcus sp. PCC 73109]|uniref:chemotaxis protein CheW n=1 Tax=Picosynechococcus sp. PCC 73109 TaxID=374982 RepID=UPI0007457C80|nr:chemotaxis protein CheW [Picosynechococcus sp. PCC 73109]AMA07871.1 chemotaxis protein CheW [Picosynechococcus sp. PCC 73109]